MYFIHPFLTEYIYVEMKLFKEWKMELKLFHHFEKLVDIRNVYRCPTLEGGGELGIDGGVVGGVGNKNDLRCFDFDKKWN